MFKPGSYYGGAIYSKITLNEFDPSNVYKVPASLNQARDLRLTDRYRSLFQNSCPDSNYIGFFASEDGL